jgi:hypothetical protein
MTEIIIGDYRSYCINQWVTNCGRILLRRREGIPEGCQGFPEWLAGVPEGRDTTRKLNS